MIFAGVYIKVPTAMKTKKRRIKGENINIIALKAMRKGNREAEQELLGPGFHSAHHVHQSKKVYSRKKKHKASEEQ